MVNTNSTLHDPRHMTVITLFKKARSDQRLTQDELAEIMGVTRVYISKTETGERNLSYIELVDYCKALGLDVHAVISSISGEVWPDEYYERDLFIAGFATGFLTAHGVDSENTISARIRKRKNEGDR